SSAAINHHLPGRFRSSPSGDKSSTLFRASKGWAVRRAIIVFFLSGVCAACSSGTSGSNLLPHTPGGNGGPPPVTSATPSPTPTATATFKPASVHLTEYAVDATPQYVGAQPDGSVYFGFGANGGGSNLYRYAGGSFTQTPPAAPPSGFGPGGGVYSITATPSQVYWLSAYSGSGFAPYVTVSAAETEMPRYAGRQSISRRA